MHSKVVAHLTRSAIVFTERKHADCGVPINSPADYAKAIGYSIERITKSLFLKAKTGEHLIAVCSINKKIKFDLIATELGIGRLEVASRDELSSHLGYPPTGVSPLGVDYHVVIDKGLLGFATVLVGGGEVGHEIELAPADLVKITSAKTLNFSE